MAGNEVKLVFTGEEEPLVRSFKTVGGAAERVDEQAREAGAGFDRVGEAADNLDTKAMGFRDTLTGVQDTMGGVGMIAKGDLFQGFFTLGAGVGDLGSAFYNLLIPTLKSSVSWLAQTKVGTLATAAAQRIAGAGARIWAAGQWVLNAALSANPIGLVVIAIGALILIFAVAWRHSETFRRIVIGAGQAVANWFHGLPGRLRSAFSSIPGVLTAPFRTGFNAIARAWNATVGRLSWSVPSWVPGIGGHGVSAPRLPTFDTGGVVPGLPGQQLLAVVQAGERISTVAAGPAGGGGALTLRSDGSRISDALVELLEAAIRSRGLQLGAART